MTNRWSIRSKITMMLAIPLVMLVALWLFAVGITVGSALELRGAEIANSRATEPGEALVAQLQAERRLSALYVASGRGNAQVLTDQRARTDAAASTYRRLATSEAVQDAVSAQTLRRITDSVAALDGIAKARQSLDSGAELDDGLAGFTEIIAATEDVFGSLAEHTDSSVAQEARGIYLLGQAAELVSQEDALITAFATENDFTTDDRDTLVSLVGQIRLLLPYGTALLAQPQQDAYAKLAAGTAFTHLNALEANLVAAQAGPTAKAPVTLAVWQAAFEPFDRQFRDFRVAADRTTVAHATSASNGILLRLAMAGLLGLLAVVGSAILSVRIGRSLVQRLGGLRRAADDLAGERLPLVVARLRNGEEVDVAVESPALDLGADEIGRVAEAFNSVQRTAMASAVEEASVRRGMNEVFLNIARRSQTLLHRQLALLDGMERRASEPEELAELFRVDHLATRMRRHAEDLVILAGASPGRGWRQPIAMVDVVRGAVSEVEDYARIRTPQVGPASVLGRAVGDVIHLLAELMENATSLSPPHTHVTVTGQLVPNGYVVEIEDRGLGMTEDAMTEANQRLADPPEFDPLNSARLGLFVVAQLARRHGIRVSLRSNPYAGVTAVVLLPKSVLDGPGAEQRPVTRSQDTDVTTADPRRFSWLGRREAEAADAHSSNGSNGSNGATVPPEWPLMKPADILTAPISAIRAGSDPDPEPAGPETGSAGSDADLASEVGPTARHSRLPGLPRRVRQASLAPQLQRATPADSRNEAAEPADPPVRRSPEQMHSMMTSFQTGTRRGRADEPTTDTHDELDGQA